MAKKVKAKVKAKRPPNPKRQDATLINIDALKRRVTGNTKDIKLLIEDVKDLLNLKLMLDSLRNNVANLEVQMESVVAKLPSHQVEMP